ncbi:MAG TPA: hypothetical protein VF316_06780 [Polyangiaceae bacterium]
MIRRALAVLLFATTTACNTCGTGATGGDGGVAGQDAAEPVVHLERTPEAERLWAEAKEGDENELTRLALVEGAAGLVERAAEPAYRRTALRAMAYADGFAQLPTLGDAAAKGAPDEAAEAAESAAILAARVRRQVDPEDAEELKLGCTALLAAAKDQGRPRPVRLSAIRALRMLVEHHGVAPADIPTDLDPK